MLSSTLPKSNPFVRNRKIRDGISQAIYEAMAEDASIHLFGEGCEVKAHYDSPQIERDFLDRCHTLPISEDGNVNLCVGASLLGVTPIVDIISADFLFRAMDSIANTAAKLDFVSGQEHTIIIRAELLTGGPTTGQRIESLFAHIPGLNVIIPSTPRDAYGLMRKALRTPGVTLFFEDREIADDLLEAEDCQYVNVGEFGVGRWRSDNWKFGGYKPDVTVVTYGLMRQRVEQALLPQRVLPREARLQVDVVDLRSIYPIDWPMVRGACERSKKLLIVEPDIAYGGVGAEIVATIAQEMPDVRVRRLGAPRATLPASQVLHSQMMPTEQEILRGIADFAKN